MAIDDLLRVAWWARREGFGPLREAMLTLAVAEAAPGSGWAERCRARLLSERPGHFLGTHASLERTLSDPRVVEAIGKLRGRYPTGRVGWLRFRSEVIAGPYTGEIAPLEAVIEALAGPPAEAEVRRDAPEPIRGPLARARVAVAATIGATTGSFRPACADIDGESSPEGIGAEESDAGFYLAVLLAIALLMASVEQDRRTRTA